MKFYYQYFAALKINKCLGSCLKWTLCFIYYTSIFIVIIGLAIGIAVGVISCVVKNATQVVGFITSHENFISDNPKIFGKNNYLQYLDVCLNENGELASKLGLIESFENIDNITDISDETEKLINITNVTSPMIDYYLHYLNNLSDLYLEGQLYNFV